MVHVITKVTKVTLLNIHLYDQFWDFIIAIKYTIY